jgi:hypothetical protein
MTAPRMVEQLPVRHALMTKDDALGGADRRSALQRYCERSHQDGEQSCDSRHARNPSSRHNRVATLPKDLRRSGTSARILLESRDPSPYCETQRHATGM